MGTVGFAAAASTLEFTGVVSLPLPGSGTIGTTPLTNEDLESCKQDKRVNDIQ
jgi:hypothetical protein